MPVSLNCPCASCVAACLARRGKVSPALVLRPLGSEFWRYPRLATRGLFATAGRTPDLFVATRPGRHLVALCDLRQDAMAEQGNAQLAARLDP